MSLRAIALSAAAILSACGAPGGRSSSAAGGACRGTCYFVDARSGSDQNDGLTPSTAFATLDRAATQVKPGSTVLAMSGTYGPVTLSASGTPDAWITFQAAPDEHPVIQIPRGPGAWAGIYLPGSAYVVIDGFEVVGQNPSIGAPEAAQNDGTQPFLNENCIYVDGAGYPGFRPPVPHDIVIRNTTVHDCSSAGIAVIVADAITLVNNRVYDNAWWTVYGASGIELYHLTDVPGSGTSNGYKNVISGNLVYGNDNRLPWIFGHPAGIYDGNGIILDDGYHRQPPVGVADLGSRPYTGRSYLANNIVHDNGGRGIHVFSSAHIDIVNNTAWNDLLNGSPHIESAEIDAQDSADVNVVNNVAVNLNGRDANSHDGGTYSYNVWNGPRVPYRGGGHDLVADPMLADPAGGDFTPLADSPALRSGTRTLAPPGDFFGNPRSGAIDRGAIQVTR